MNPSVVITGCGVVAPNGTGVDRFWQNLIAGRSGITPIADVDIGDRTHPFGGQVHDFTIGTFSSNVAVRQWGRGSQLALGASLLALEDAGLSSGDVQQTRTGIYLGTTMGESPIAEGFVDHLHNGGGESDHEDRLEYYAANLLTALVAGELGLRGPSGVIPTACAAGNYGIAYACEALAEGRADRMLAGGVDPWSRTAYHGFRALMAISPDRCRPFDRNRKGILISEGAGVVVLERADDARRRGARIYAELAGYGIGADGHHMTGPHPAGRGGILAARRALQRAGVNSDDVDYVSAHGTGTPANDRIETLILKSVLGHSARTTPVSSIKSMLGHTLGAASALETIACACAIATGVIPPTINYETPDPECDLDVVPNEARRLPVRVAMNNAFAFGGNCSTLILRAVNRGPQ